MEEAYGRFAEIYDRLMQEVDYDAWASYLDALIQRYSPGSKPVSLHECACGTGELTTRLVKMGYAVTASDASGDMLRVAQEKTMQFGQRIPFIGQDMRFLCLHKPVDAVVAACDGVNYLLDSDDLTAFFRSAANALKKGGLLLFDCSTEHKLRDVIGYSTFGEDAGDVAYLWRNAYDAETRLSEMRLTFFVRAGELYRRFTERHVQRAHRTAELSAALAECGFADIRSFDAFSFLPETAESERVQFVARRL